MILIVDAVIDGVYCRNLARSVGQEEAAFAALNELVNQGFQFQRALLREGPHQLALPVEAFDGQQVDDHLRLLEKQWQQLLNPALSSRDTSESFSIYLRLNDYYEALLANVEQMLSQLEVRRSSIQLVQTVEIRNRLIRQLDVLLERNQRLCRRAQASYQKNQERLCRLNGDEHG